MPARAPPLHTSSTATRKKDPRSMQTSPAPEQRPGTR